MRRSSWRDLRKKLMADEKERDDARDRFKSLIRQVDKGEGVVREERDI